MTLQRNLYGGEYAASMKRPIQALVLSGCLAVIAGCSAIEKTDSFTLTADLPPNFAYVATVYYKPAVGETCTVPAKENKADVLSMAPAPSPTTAWSTTTTRSPACPARKWIPNRQ